MQQSNKVAGYLETVRQQIRWKKAHPYLLKELEDHLLDQRDAFQSEGLDDAAALNLALSEMGDPVLVGEQLDRVHRPKPDWPLLAMTALLFVLGILAQYIINTDVSYPAINGKEVFFRQIIWDCLALAIFLATYYLDFTFLGRYPLLAYSLILGLALANFFMEPYIQGYSGAIYPLLLFPAIFAGLVYKQRNQGYLGILLCGGTLMIPAFIAAIVPSATFLFIIVTSSLVILTFAIVKGWFKVRKLLALLMVYLSGVLMALVLFFASMSNIAWYRLQILLNPSLDPYGFGYVSTIVRKALRNSQIWGGGSPIEDYGQMTLAQLLPSINADLTLTYLTYRFGWIAFMAIVIIFLVFMVRSTLVCIKQKSMLGQLVSLAIILTIALQFITYLASNLGFGLLSPISLPLISYGGRAMLINMCLIGFLLSTFRTGSLVKDNASQLKKVNRLLQYEKGKLTINFRLFG